MTNQISTSDLETFNTLFTPRIQADIPAWYGRQARLVGTPTCQRRPWSFFFRYRIRLSDSREQAVLVKIRHDGKMQLAEAMQDMMMRAQARDEFESLVKVRDNFTNIEAAALFAAIRPLAYYADINALVTEEMEICNFKSNFERPAMWVEGRARKTFDAQLELAGRWLRIFHEKIGEAAEATFFSGMRYDMVRENLNRIQSTSGLDLKFLQSLLDKLYQQFQGKTLEYRILHGDYHMSNVFITGEGKVCSFDSHNLPGPIYVDLAKMITNMETCRIQVATYGLSVPAARLEGFNAAFLRGYFNSGPVDHDALNLYRLIRLIEKWDEDEDRLEKVAGSRKLSRALVAIPVRSYFLRLIRKQVQAHWV